MKRGHDARVCAMGLLIERPRGPHGIDGAPCRRIVLFVIAVLGCQRRLVLQHTILMVDL